MFRPVLQNFFSDKKMVLPVEFVLNMGLVYFIWRSLKYGGENFENFLLGGWDSFYTIFGRFITALSADVLRLLGFKVIDFHRMIFVEGSPGVYIGDLCLGVAPLFIFAGFILSYGDNWRNKFWFIPLGWMLILITNVIRTIALVLVLLYEKQWFKLAHEYVYVVLTYGVIFLLVMWWMNKLADNPKLTQEGS
jgi:exosortase/archaeosortase family protein